MTIKLKIKIKSLADEARHIRREEREELRRRRFKGDPNRLFYDRLHDHRLHVVRPAARRSLLAYAFLRARPYAKAEGSVRKDNEPDWAAVWREVERFCEANLDMDMLRSEFLNWAGLMDHPTRFIPRLKITPTRAKSVTTRIVQVKTSETAA